MYCYRNVTLWQVARGRDHVFSSKVSLSLFVCYGDNSYLRVSTDEFAKGHTLNLNIIIRKQPSVALATVIGLGIFSGKRSSKV